MTRHRISMQPVAAWFGWLVPRFGMRVLKTCLAITCSVLTARLFHLEAPQFAGIVSVLAVQPSVCRSLRQGAQQMASALIGAAVGTFSLYTLGPSAWVIGVVALLLMGWHVRWGWTQSLLVAVVIALNTIGSHAGTYIDGGLNQLALVLIGVGYGNLINLLIKPAHDARSKDLLLTCEREVFRLLRTLYRDLQRGKATHYLVFRKTIDKVRASIEEGKRIAGFVTEDHARSVPKRDPLDAFHTLESMVERIRDMNKTLQRLSTVHEQADLVRLVDVTMRVQRRMVWGHGCHFTLVDAAYRKVEKQYHIATLPTTHDEFIQQATEYHLFLYLKEYYERLQRLGGDPSKPIDIARHA